jgi:hypothetical protein
MAAMYLGRPQAGHDAGHRTDCCPASAAKCLIDKGKVVLRMAPADAGTLYAVVWVNNPPSTTGEHHGCDA